MAPVGGPIMEEGRCLELGVIGLACIWPMADGAMFMGAPVVAL